MPRTFCSRIDAEPLGTVVRITTQADFGPVVVGVITLMDQVYYLANNVTIDEGVELVFDPEQNANITLRADSEAVKLIGNVGAGSCFVQFPNQGVISQIAIVNEGGGDVVMFASRTDPFVDAAANFCLLHMVNISSPSNSTPSQTLVRVVGDAAPGQFTPQVQISDCNIGLFATDGSIRFQDGRVAFFDMSGSLVPNGAGPSVLMASSFAGFTFGASIVGGSLGAAAADPAITLEAGGSILAPGATRLLLVQAVNFLGGILGFTTADADVIFAGNQGVQNSLFLGAAGYIGNLTPTAIVSTGAFVPINDGGLIVTNPTQQRFTRSGLEFTYDGLVQRNCHVSWSICIQSVSANPVVACQVEVNAGSGFVAVPNSVFAQEATNRDNTFGSDARFIIQPGDVVRITIANLESTVDIIVTAYNIDIDAT